VARVWEVEKRSLQQIRVIVGLALKFPTQATHKVVTGPFRSSTQRANPHTFAPNAENHSFLQKLPTIEIGEGNIFRAKVIPAVRASWVSSECVSRLFPERFCSTMTSLCRSEESPTTHSPPCNYKGT
jgi:hypothetical protein